MFSCTRGFVARNAQGHQHVFKRRELGHQHVGLKNKPHLPIAKLRSLSLSHMAAFMNVEGVANAFLNSLIAAAVTVVLSVALGAPAGYALARYAFRGADAFKLLVLLTRGIDLSVASNLALTGMACALIGKAFPEVNIVVLIIMALAVGALLGSINGWLITGFNLPPIVVTLGTLSAYRGAIFVASKGAWIFGTSASAAAPP
jgi:ABC-type xylose transport system permease subunit